MRSALRYLFALLETISKNCEVKVKLEHSNRTSREGWFTPAGLAQLQNSADQIGLGQRG